MSRVGLPIAVANAVKEVKEISLHVTDLSGGEGAFREAVYWIVSKQGRIKETLKVMKERVLNN